MSMEDRLSKLEQEYDDFMKTEDGKKWEEGCKDTRSPDNCGGFGDYLYDFYPDILA